TRQLCVCQSTVPIERRRKSCGFWQDGPDARAAQHRRRHDGRAAADRRQCSCLCAPRGRGSAGGGPQGEPGLPSLRSAKRQPHRDIQGDLSAARIYPTACAPGVRSAGGCHREPGRTAAKPVHSARRHDRQEPRTAGPLYEPAGPMTAVAIAGVIQGLRGRREHLSAASIYEGLGDATKERWNAQALGKDVMRLFALALTLSLADFAVASAQTATPDSESRYSFNPVADGVLRLDTRTGQVSQCSRSDVGWACKLVPDER